MTGAFFWGLVAASSLLVGALVVFIHKPGDRALGLIMGFGSGVLISAVSFELVQEATEVAGGTGGTFLGLLAGAAVFTIGDYAISRLGGRDHKPISSGTTNAAAMTIVLGTVLDGVPESAVLGLTLLQTGVVNASMLVAVFVSNVPESIAASDGLLRGGWTRQRVLGLWAGVALVSALASYLGYVLLETAGPATNAFVLAFAGGAILVMLATSMMPEAFEHGGRLSGLATVLGFIVAYAIDWIAA
jgi:ZIP family zinc transporter